MNDGGPNKLDTQYVYFMYNPAVGYYLTSELVTSHKSEWMDPGILGPLISVTILIIGTSHYGAK